MPGKFHIFRMLRVITILLFVLLQLAVIVVLTVYGSRFSFWIEYGLTLASILVVFHVVGDRNGAAFRILWIILILSFPVFGGLLYLLFNYQSSTARFKRDLQQAQEKAEKYFIKNGTEADLLKNAPIPNSEFRTPNSGFRTPDSLVQYLKNFAGFPVYSHTRTAYLSPGEVKRDRLLEVLRGAEKYIFLEYFSIAEGEFWSAVLEILKEKAAAGLDVRVIYDDAGCLALLPRNYPKQLAKFGIRAVVFNPFRPFLTAKQNNRDHRKIAVADGKIAVTGGINLADEYVNARRKYGHWKDAAVLAEGEAAWSFTLMFLQMWDVCAKTDEDYGAYYPWGAEPCPIADGGLVQPYADSPLSPERVGEHIYLKIAYNAKKYLYINTPYLIIDNSMMTALTLAAKSGVDVRVVTPHHPDKFYVHMVTRSNYLELIRAGVKVYEYTDGFIHSKTFLCDGETATVGSVNLDYRSLYLSFECGACLYGTAAVEELHQDYMDTLERCRLLTEADCKTGRIKRVVAALFRLLSPLL